MSDDSRPVSADAKDHREKIHSLNPLERSMAEITRCTDVVGIFPGAQVGP